MAWLYRRCADLWMVTAVDWEEEKRKNMKLRKTVEMSIEEAQDDFCYRYETCGVCPLNKKAPSDCLAWCVAHPHEAARLMGYEVVEDGQYICPSCGNALPENPIGGYTCPYCGYGERTEKKEANMDKPLKDWTLGEVQDYCKKHDCTPDCPLKKGDGECRINRLNPCEWDLSEKPRFTQQEVERAKAIKVIWPNADRIQGSCGSFGVGMYYVWFSSDLLGQINDDDCFPSIGSGETVTLDEIIGGAE